MRVLLVALCFCLSSAAISSGMTIDVENYDRRMTADITALNPSPTNLVHDTAFDRFSVNFHLLSPNDVSVELMPKTAFGIKYMLEEKPTEARDYLKNLFQQSKKCGNVQDEHYDTMASFIITNADDFKNIIPSTISGGTVKVQTNTNGSKNENSFRLRFSVFNASKC
ncbi:hypothetical protein HA402_001464 [Bradysia odoriphaga]|nr:hypothetical protein HA402_001464 [Bradysia odoriphaga]